MCNIGSRYGLAEVAHKLSVLREHCHELGRPYEDIEKTSLEMALVTRDGSNGTLTSIAMLERCKQLADLGITHLMLSLPSSFDAEAFELIIREVLPQAQKM